MMKRILALVVVVLLAVTIGYAQDIGLKAVGGGLGYGSVSFKGGSGSETLGGIAISAHAYLGDFAKGFGLYPELQYLMVSKDVSGVKWSVSDFAINANVRYGFEMEGQVKPYVGAGLGLNFLSSEVEMPTVATPFGSFGGKVSASDTKIGINLMAGANYQLNPKLTLFFEPRYVLVSDANQLILKVGATYAL